MGPKSVTDVPLHEYYCHRICIGLGGYSNYRVLHSTNCYFQLVFPLDTCWLSIAITIATREHKTDSVETSARASLLIINLSLLSLSGAVRYLRLFILLLSDKRDAAVKFSRDQAEGRTQQRE